MAGFSASAQVEAALDLLDHSQPMKQVHTVDSVVTKKSLALHSDSLLCRTAEDLLSIEDTHQCGGTHPT